MNQADCYKIGYVLKPHGLKGEVTISIDAEAPENLNEVESVLIERNNRLVPYFIESISINNDKAFVKFEEVESSEQALEISKSALYLPKSLRPKSSRGEFYDDEIIGFSVSDKSFGELGVVTEIQQAGPNKLITLVRGEKEILIPVNAPFITSINKTKKTIAVDLPEGFLDI